MSDCQRRYDSTSGCSPTPTPSVNHLLRASAIVATGVFLAITVFVLLCILHKRRVIVFVRFHTIDRRPHLTPSLYVWSGPNTDSPAHSAAPQTDEPAQVASARVGKSPKGVTAAAVAMAEPLSCVIMAGEERPTYLARPLPRDEFVDVSLDPKLDAMERGKRKPILNPR